MLAGKPGTKELIIPPQLLYASGFLFMGATEEQMALLASSHVTHVSYVLLLYSLAFLLFLFVSVLLRLYANATWPLSSSPLSSGGVMALKKDDGENGIVVGNGNGHLGRIKDAEEFELEGLMSDAEDGEGDEVSVGSSGGRGRKESQRVG